MKLIRNVDSKWTVNFDKKWGGPEEIVFDSLKDWSQHDSLGIKYYSGKANYKTTIQLNSKQISCHINHQLTKKRSDLAHALPLQIIHPKSFELLDAGPQLRREFIDWGVFHDNENFVQNYSNFKVALLQRNALLKSKQVQQIDVWNKEFAYYGTIVNSFREIYLLKLFKKI